MNRIKVIFLMFLSLTMLMSSCDIVSTNPDKMGILPVIEVSGGSDFSPEGGVSMSEAPGLIASYLSQNGMKGEIRSQLKLTELTVKELWDSTHVQVYRVEVGYASLYGIAVIQSKKVLCVLEGMPTKSVFLADLDGDQHYEVYTNIFWGSGIVSSEIRGYDIVSDIKYSLSKRMQKDLLLFTRENALWVKEYTYGTPMDRTGEPVSEGKLAIREKEGKKELYIETGQSIKSENDKSENKRSGFAIYLVKNNDGFGVIKEDINKLGQMKLDDIILDDEAILTGEDVVAYHWKVSDQAGRGAGLTTPAKQVDYLELQNGVLLRDRIQKKAGSIGKHYPFVVVADGKRIYLGLFFSPLSSVYFPGAFHISIDYLMPTKGNMYMLVQDTSTDQLQDQRVYQALKIMNKLKE